MAYDVCIRMPGGALLRWHADAAEHEWPSLRETMKVVPRADTAAGHGCRRPSGCVQIVGGRNFHVRRVALDHVHAVTGALREHRLIGRLDPGSTDRDRGAQHFAAKRLWRLRKIDRVAWNRGR